MEEIARRRPVDAVAARVTQPGPKGYESSKRIAQTCSPTPLPMRPIPPHAPNLLDFTVGTLTVVGVSIRKKADGTLLWVCRCVCGSYVERTSKAVRNNNNGADRCDRCRNVFYLRRASTFRQLGFHPDEQPESADAVGQRGDDPI